MLAAVDQVQIEPGVQLHCERGALRGMAAVLSSIDQPKRRPHLPEPLPERLRFSLRFLRAAAARATTPKERLEILPRTHAVPRLQGGRRHEASSEGVPFG